MTGNYEYILTCTEVLYLPAKAVIPVGGCGAA